MNTSARDRREHRGARIRQLLQREKDRGHPAAGVPGDGSARIQKLEKEGGRRGSVLERVRQKEKTNRARQQLLLLDGPRDGNTVGPNKSQLREAEVELRLEEILREHRGARTLSARMLKRLLADSCADRPLFAGNERWVDEAVERALARGRAGGAAFEKVPEDGAVRTKRVPEEGAVQSKK